MRLCSEARPPADGLLTLDLRFGNLPRSCLCFRKASLVKGNFLFGTLGRRSVVDRSSSPGRPSVVVVVRSSLSSSSFGGRRLSVVVVVVRSSSSLGRRRRSVVVVGVWERPDCGKLPRCRGSPFGRRSVVGRRSVIVVVRSSSSFGRRFRRLGVFRSGG